MSYPRINQHDRNCILILGRCRMTSGKIQLQRFITHFKTNVAKTGSGKRGTGNGERATGNKERGTGNRERESGNLRTDVQLENSKFQTKEKKGSKGIQTSSKRNNLGKREFLPAVPPDAQYVLVRAESHWHWDNQSM